MQIILEKSKCIGCGSCAAVCPKLFEMGEDGKARLKNSKTNSENEILEIGEEKCAKEATEVCSVQAIKVLVQEREP